MEVKVAYQVAQIYHPYKHYPTRTAMMHASAANFFKLINNAQAYLCKVLGYIQVPCKKMLEIQKKTHIFSINISTPSITCKGLSPPYHISILLLLHFSMTLSNCLHHHDKHLLSPLCSGSKKDLKKLSFRVGVGRLTFSESWQS